MCLTVIKGSSGVGRGEETVCWKISGPLSSFGTSCKLRCLFLEPKEALAPGRMHVSLKNHAPGPIRWPPLDFNPLQFVF